MKKLLLITFFMLIAFTGFSQTAITATIAYQGYDETQAHLGQAEYQVFMDTTDGVLDKPIILIDGFDPSDSRDIAGMYTLLDYNGNNIADQLRAEGFDFVFVNFPTYTRASDQVEVNGGGDYIQRNAMVLVEILNQINAQKTGSEELVIIGPSMGGLVSRYALRYMEQNSIAHQTRLFVSWDTPHKGANIPIEFQYLLNYFAEVNGGNADLQASIATSINSPASKEMLIDHYTAHLQNGSTYQQDSNLLLPIGAANFRDAFQAEIDAMGFPQQTRNISITNGSGIGATSGTPGMEILNHTFDVPNVSNTTAEIVLHFAPAANQNIEVTKVITRYFSFQIASFYADAQSFSYTDGLDSAPGGKQDMAAFLQGSQNALVTELLANLQQSEFCFIPTVSAMAISNENNWYANINIPNTHTTEFDAWYIPDANELHVTPTQANVDFVLPEIRNSVASVSNTILNKKYVLKSNPITTELVVLLDNNFNYPKIELSIYNINGQQLIQKTFINTTSNLSFPIQLENGIYFLKIKDNQNYFVKKIIVNQQ